MNHNLLHVFKGGMLANFFFKWQHVLIYWACKMKRKKLNHSFCFQKEQKMKKRLLS